MGEADRGGGLQDMSTGVAAGGWIPRAGEKRVALCSVHLAAKSEPSSDRLSAFAAKQMPGRDAQFHADAGARKPAGRAVVAVHGGGVPARRACRFAMPRKVRVPPPPGKKGSNK